MMNNNKGGAWSYIFPRGGIDTRYDGWEAGSTDAFRKAAIREAWEEAGVRVKEAAADITYLTRTDSGAEYWYFGTVDSTDAVFPEQIIEQEKGNDITLGFFTYDEAMTQLTTTNTETRNGKTGKAQPMMLEALLQARKLGLI